MILVIVGLMYGFESLVKGMDEIAGKIEEKVIMQIGNTSYEPKNADYFRFVPEQEIERLYNNSRIVVCHAGVGSILTALQHGKPTIVVPRKKKYGEHVDDHQLEIANKWEEEGKIIVAHDIAELESVLFRISTASFIKIENENKLVKKLKEYLDGIKN